MTKNLADMNGFSGADHAMLQMDEAARLAYRERIGQVPSHVDDQLTMRK
jgi:hypothetical protein